MLKKLLLVSVFICNISLSQNILPLIPQPKSLIMGDGIFILNGKTEIQADKNSFEAKYLQDLIQQQLGLHLKISEASKAESKIIFSLKIIEEKKSFKEWYTLAITSNRITITATEDNGLFYAIQTLAQLLPLEKNVVINLPCLTIIDEPQYAWRGMHLDCARHFFPKEFIKKYIDYLAMYKLNTFHWHLTDDQGWRVEIKKYPKLTSVGAFRNGSMVGPYSDQTFDDKRYGGFYTQQDIKEIVAYANDRHITIIPEIEMPGHAVAALAAYPEFSCTGGPLEVGKTWGVLEDVFCAKEETFTFLENVLTEIIDLFPSTFIHIGGDESPKVRWKVCANCQKRIKDENLKDEHELQSYFIQRIEKFVNSKGRKIIGWDEILEGGLAPNAAVMSWRGIQGGIAAAKQEHFVVMSPGSHCYFDHYQGDPKNEPIAFGGYTTVEKVYSFNPTPSELSTQEARYILGAQANLWTEYIETPSHAEYMLFPRIAALAEVVWGTSNPEKYNNFQDRLLKHFDLLEKKGINYSKAIFEITSKVNPSLHTNTILFELKSGNNSNGSRYTTDGSNPNLNSPNYSNPIAITKSQTVKAALFENNKQKSAIIEQRFYWSKAVGKKITLLHLPHENYNNGGAFTLVDGSVGDRSKFGRDWLGFSGKDVNAIIDLGQLENINKVLLCVLERQGSWIYYPKNIEVLLSNDGSNFKKVAQLDSLQIESVKGEVVLEFALAKAQFVKVVATNLGKIPDGNPGAGSDAWLFIDEIGVE